MKELKKYKVTIAGESYFLVSDESEDRVLKVAEYVDNQMRAIAKSGYSDDPQRLAVLVALQCTSKMMEHLELLHLHQNHNEHMIELISRDLPQEPQLNLG